MDVFLWIGWIISCHRGCWHSSGRPPATRYGSAWSHRLHAGGRARFTGVLPGVGGHRDDSRAQLGFVPCRDAPAGLEPVHLRHLHIHQHHVPRLALDGIDRLRGGAGDFGLGWRLVGYVGSCACCRGRPVGWRSQQDRRRPAPVPLLRPERWLMAARAGSVRPGHGARGDGRDLGAHSPLRPARRLIWAH